MTLDLSDFKHIPIDGFENYLIDKKGTIISLKRRLPHIMKPKMDKDGYLEIGLRKFENGKNIKKFFRVHRLVALAYIPNPNDLPLINHKNNNRNDNRTDNLEWCNSTYNNQYAFKMGREPSYNGQKKVVVLLNGNIVNEFGSIKACAEYFGMSDGHVRRIIKGQLNNNGKLKDYEFKIISNN
jgi:hypothetical protein